MADIFEFVKKSDNCRPVYTSYELSSMVKEKRKNERLDVKAFSKKHGVSEDILDQIENGRRVFSTKMYKSCGTILGLSTEEMLAEYEDDISAVNFRASENDESTQKTFDLVNMLFNEIIMQEKISR